ncbi:hypothetical protein TIFTF001_010249 [Ficus carica]|uniref:Uncharacterized protein n=1 Tax=Ficus carica TaxID=3494 RepID=A0AA88D4B2_FICCA|nr:hypothetical protein TIFTF001_010249 [Ficus carica]
MYSVKNVGEETSHAIEKLLKLWQLSPHGQNKDIIDLEEYIVSLGAACQGCNISLEFAKALTCGGNGSGGLGESRFLDVCQSSSPCYLLWLCDDSTQHLRSLLFLRVGHQRDSKP